jgi:hypothetical protein
LYGGEEKHGHSKCFEWRELKASPSLNLRSHVMPIFGWIRDLFGIQKDMYDTKKTRLEINQLEDVEREKLITPVTLDDVKRYDPKISQIETNIKEEYQRGIARKHYHTGGCYGVSLVTMILVLMLVGMLVKVVELLLRYLFRW